MWRPQREENGNQIFALKNGLEFSVEISMKIFVILAIERNLLPDVPAQGEPMWLVQIYQLIFSIIDFDLFCFDLFCVILILL